MSEESLPPMTPLDQMVSQSSVQMLKAAVSYLPMRTQRFFAIYAKLAELSHTISAFSMPQAELTMMSESRQAAVEPTDLLNQLRTYAGNSEKEKIDQLLFAFHALEILQMSQDTPDLS